MGCTSYSAASAIAMSAQAAKVKLSLIPQTQSNVCLSLASLSGCEVVLLQVWQLNVHSPTSGFPSKSPVNPLHSPCVTATWPDGSSGSTRRMQHRTPRACQHQLETPAEAVMCVTVVWGDIQAWIALKGKNTNAAQGTGNQVQAIRCSYPYGSSELDQRTDKVVPCTAAVCIPQ